MPVNAKVTDNTKTVRASVSSDNTLLVSAVNQLSNLRLGDLLDIDTTQAKDGATLLFNSNGNIFEATGDLNNKNTNINGGHY
jgi:hypothetical protein